MSNTNTNFEMTRILLGQGIRKLNSSGKDRHYPADDGPGMNVSHVARLHGNQPSLLFKWKKQYQGRQASPLRAGEGEVVPASELTAAALKQVRDFSAFWARKTMEVEI